MAGICSAAAFAQDGTYITATAGLGTSSIKTNITYFDRQANAIERSSIIGYSASIGIGYRYKN